MCALEPANYTLKQNIWELSSFLYKLPTWAHQHCFIIHQQIHTIHTVSCKSEARAGTLTLPLPYIFTHFMYSYVMMKHVLSARGAIRSEARKSYTCVHCMKIDWIRNK